MIEFMSDLWGMDGKDRLWGNEGKKSRISLARVNLIDFMRYSVYFNRGHGELERSSRCTRGSYI